MPSVNSAKVNEWVQIIGIFGVLAGLVFLSYEIQQNTRAVQNESYLSVMAMLTDQQMALTTDEDLNRIVMIGEVSPKVLTAEEWARFTQFIMPRFGVWEYLYLGRQDGSVTDTLWSAYDPYYLSIVCKPGYKQWLVEFGDAFAPDFLNYLNLTIQTNCTN